MNTMMLALLQGRLQVAASTLQQQLQEADDDRQASAAELSQVVRALDALQQGHYGWCSSCDQPLEPDRLLVKPYRLVCAECEAMKAMDVPADLVRHASHGAAPRCAAP